VNLLRRLSRAISRFTEWLAPAAAADSVMTPTGSKGGDPRGLELLRDRLDDETDAR
jgi:hypothetical protein